MLISSWVYSLLDLNAGSFTEWVMFVWVGRKEEVNVNLGEEERGLGKSRG